ncbi:MAG: PIN domain-containing protein [Salinivirgaceae bacterium]
MDIAIDTNIIRGDFFFKSKEFEILFDYLKKTESKFIISEVVLQETEEIYRRTLLEQKDILQKNQESIHNILNREIPLISDNIDIEIETRKYISFLKEKLSLTDKNIIEYDKEYLPELIKRAVKKTMPFKNEDKGFRDTVIWLSLKDYCKKVQEKQIIFISNNPTDFGNSKVKNKLNESLEIECTEEKIRINYFNTIKDFVEYHSIKIDFINHDWISEQLSDERISEMVIEKMESKDLVDWVVSRTDIYPISSVRAISAYPNGYGEISIYEMIDNSLILNLSIDCETEMEIESVGYNLHNGFNSYGVIYKYLEVTADFSITVKDKEIVDIEVDYWE